MRAKEKLWKSRVPLFLINVVDRLLLLFFCIVRYRRLTGTAEKQPIFIIGSGRSGNTLLRSMLVAGGDVAIPPESYVIPRCIRRYCALSFLPWDVLSSIILAEFSVYKEFYTWDLDIDNLYSELRNAKKRNQNLAYILESIYEHYRKTHFPDARLWADKTPINTLHLSKLIKVFPKAKFVHIVRDPRAVSSSYVASGLESGLIDAANVWKASVDAVSNLKKKNKSLVFEIRYEDLVRYPEKTLISVCEFIGIKYNSAMLNYWDRDYSLGDIELYSHHENSQKHLDTSRLSAWRKNISKDDLQNINKIAGAWLEYYKFD